MRCIENSGRPPKQSNKLDAPSFSDERHETPAAAPGRLPQGRRDTRRASRAASHSFAAHATMAGSKTPKSGKGSKGKPPAGTSARLDTPDELREKAGALRELAKQQEQQVNSYADLAGLLGDAIVALCQDKGLKPEDLFRRWDQNSSGFVSKMEFRLAVRDLLGLSIKASSKAVDALFYSFDLGQRCARGWMGARARTRACAHMHAQPRARTHGRMKRKCTDGDAHRRARITSPWARRDGELSLAELSDAIKDMKGRVASVAERRDDVNRLLGMAEQAEAAATAAETALGAKQELASMVAGASVEQRVGAKVLTLNKKKKGGKAAEMLEKQFDLNNDGSVDKKELLEVRVYPSYLLHLTIALLPPLPPSRCVYPSCAFSTSL